MSPCNNNCKTKRGLTWCVIAMSSFALLIWAKLRLVTGVPRTAYAVPDENKSKPAPTPAANVKPSAPANP